MLEFVLGALPALVKLTAQAISRTGFQVERIGKVVDCATKDSTLKENKHYVGLSLLMLLAAQLDPANRKGSDRAVEAT